MLPGDSSPNNSAIMPRDSKMVTETSSPNPAAITPRPPVPIPRSPTGGARSTPASGPPSEAKRAYETWSTAEEGALVAWLCAPGNYDKWRCSGLKKNGGSGSQGLSKVATAADIASWLNAEHHVNKSSEKVLNKIKALEKSYREAREFLEASGEGIDDEGEKMGVSAIRNKVRKKCPHWDELDPVFKDRLANRAAYRSSSDINLDARFQLDTGSQNDDEEGYGLEGPRPADRTNAKRPAEIDSDSDADKKGRRRIRGKGTTDLLQSTLFELGEKLMLFMEKGVETQTKLQEQISLQKEQLALQREQAALQRAETEERTLRLKLELAKLGVQL